MSDDGFSEDYRAGDYLSPDNFKPIKIERRKMTENKTVRIRMKWTQCNTDPIQYKPLSPTLVPEEVFVIVEIPDDPKYVIKNPDITKIVLTPDGLALAMQNLAKAIRATYSESK